MCGGEPKMTRKDELKLIVFKLRSDNPYAVSDGERMLIRLAGLSTSGCCCPKYPKRQSPKCFAHDWLSRGMWSNMWGGLHKKFLQRDPLHHGET